MGRQADTVVVTGASGYLASEIVHQLLAAGFAVRGTVRDTSKPELTDHLTRLAAALPGSLELYEADMAKSGSFDACLQGASILFHVASPYNPKPRDGKMEVYDVAVEGVTHLLKSAAKAGTVKRLVYTGTITATMKWTSGPVNGHSFSDQDFNTDVTMDEPTIYTRSKVDSEKAAMKLCGELGISFVSILPALIVGPALSHRVPPAGGSVEALVAILEGRGNTFYFAFPHFCDVRDVAQAHLRAAVLPDAKGRYLLSQGPVFSEGVMGALAAAYPDIQFAEPQSMEEFDGSPFAPAFKTPYDSSRCFKELGIQLTPVAVSLADGARSLLALGIAKPTRKS